MPVFPLFDQSLLNSLPSHVKFKSINSSTLAKLNALRNFQDQLGLLYQGKRSHAEHRKHLVKSLEELNSKKFKVDLNLYRAECDYLKTYLSNATLKKTLETNVWDKWLITCKNKIALRQLRNFWDRCQSTNHLSLEALRITVEDILPTYESFYQLGLLELRIYKNKLAYTEYQSLKSYFHLVNEYIQAEKETTCNAMLSRLEVLSVSKNIYCSDVNNFLVDSLNELGIHLEGVARKSPKKLSQFYFELFHNYVTKNGNAEHKDQLHNFIWFAQNSHFETVIIGHQPVIKAASTLANNSSNSWSNWMTSLASHFNNENIFWKEKFYLLAQIRLQTFTKTNSMTLIELLDNRKWQHLNEFSVVLLAELNQVNTNLASRWRKFFGYQIQCNKALHACLEDALEKNLEIRIQWACLLAEQLRTRLVFDLDKKSVFTKCVFEQVSHILNEIDTFKKKIRFSHYLHTRWVEAKSILEIFCSNNDFDSNKPKNYLVVENTNILSQNDFLIRNQSHHVHEVKMIYTSLTKNNIFDLKLMMNYMPKWSFLFYLHEKIIKNDFDFWRHFLLVYINTYLVIRENGRSLSKLVDLFYTYGHDEVKRQANNFEVFDGPKRVDKLMECRSSLLSVEDPAASSRDSLKVRP